MFSIAAVTDEWLLFPAQQDQERPYHPQHQPRGLIEDDLDHRIPSVVLDRGFEPSEAVLIDRGPDIPKLRFHQITRSNRSGAVINQAHEGRREDPQAEKTQQESDHALVPSAPVRLVVLGPGSSTAKARSAPPAGKRCGSITPARAAVQQGTGRVREKRRSSVPCRIPSPSRPSFRVSGPLHHQAGRGRPEARCPARARRYSAGPRRSGGVAERLKAHAWKACIRETVSRVRIPLPPPSTDFQQSPSVPKPPMRPGFCRPCDLSLFLAMP